MGPSKKSRQSYLALALSAPAIGIYLTLAMVALTIPYYSISSSREDNRAKQSLAGLLYLAHQKSIDYRLRVRGPRAPRSDLVLLAADNRAVKTLGRWPWPRHILAKGFDEAFKNGAKLIALDMIFSEPSQNPALELVQALPANRSAQLSPLLKSLSQEADGDRELAQVLSKYTNRIVAGSFYASSRPATWKPETEFCRDLIFRKTPAFKQWDKEEVLMAPNDPYQPYMPPSLRANFSAVLDENESSIKKKLPKPIDRATELSNESILNDELNRVCDTILIDFREELNPNWATLTKNENPADFHFANYDEWLADYRRRSRPLALPNAEDWEMNTPEISSGTKHTAYFNMAQDSDGTIRSKPLIARTGFEYFPTLALKAYLVSRGYNASPRLEFNPASGEKEVVDLEILNNDDGKTVTHIPVDRVGKMLINYAGPAQMYPYLSFADLLSSSPNASIEQTVYDPKTNRWRSSTRTVNKAAFLKDKILVAGATAVGIYDLRVTPFQEDTPGTETHLNVLENLMSGNFLHAPPDERVYMPLLLLVLGFFLTYVLSTLGAISGALFTLGTFLSTAFIDQHFLFNQGLVVSIVWPITLTATLYVALTFYRYLTEERGKKELRQTFQKYVSPAIVEEILAHPDNLELGGRKAQMTIFFSDVRGFTTISEKLDPRALSDLLNSYLTPMTEIVFKNRGTLDKYMGDAVMAFFGAPIAYPDHAKWACRCALESIEKLFELQKEYEKKGLPAIDIGIGLNTGEVSVGNMGSKSVRSYTVMGDAVNLASRLEGINKTYGTRIILSEFTYAQVKDSFVCREVDWVRVKGKAQPVKIYELISELRSGERPANPALEAFSEAYAEYHARRFQRALERFNLALDLNPNDDVSKLYIQRCQDYLVDPPEAAWDGVFTMKTK